jgi:accessory gene regulator B
MLQALIAITLIAGLYAVIRYAPKDTPKKPIEGKGEIEKFKRLSVAYLLILSAVSVLLAYYGQGQHTLSISFGLLAELFMLTPTGGRFFDYIERIFQFKIRKKEVTIP